VRQSFDIFMRWFETPGIREDRMWIARQGDDVVGVSVLLYPETRGNVWTDWTGTARRIRGRGVARALKLETVAQALALGVTRVRTSNDGENAPILHLNEDMGYRPIPGSIEYHRPVTA
jgi:GNAT superfamily N-acetyltransferase